MAVSRWYRTILLQLLHHSLRSLHFLSAMAPLLKQFNFTICLNHYPFFSFFSFFSPPFSLSLFLFLSVARSFLSCYFKKKSSFFSFSSFIIVRLRILLFVHCASKTPFFQLLILLFFLSLAAYRYHFMISGISGLTSISSVIFPVSILTVFMTRPSSEVMSDFDKRFSP